MADLLFNDDRAVRTQTSFYRDALRGMLHLHLDTASPETILLPELVEVLGCSARDAIEVTSVTSIIGQEIGYRIVVDKFSSLGFDICAYEVNVHDLPADYGLVAF